MSHQNTLFSQPLSFIPRHVFQKLEYRHKAGRSSRTFGFKEQFTAMAFIQLAARRSMRDGLRCPEAAGGRLYHWGLKNVARSTFADANNSRPVGFFKDMFAERYSLCVVKSPMHKFRFKSKLFSLDATTIKLCLSLFPWAPFRQTRGGSKCMPCWTTTAIPRLSQPLPMPKCGPWVPNNSRFRQIPHQTSKNQNILRQRKENWGMVKEAYKGMQRKALGMKAPDKALGRWSGEPRRS